MRTAAVALLAMLLVACAPGGSAARPSARPPSPSARAASPSASPSASPTELAPPGPFNYTVATVAEGLVVPWALDFAPDGAIWLTERGGTVRVIRNGALVAAPALSLHVMAQAGCEGGLLGIALHAPDAYLFYTYSGGGGPTNRISRFTMAGDTLTDEKVILDGLPAGSCYHDGGRLRLGPDGLLYFTTGEGFVASRAADRNNQAGKIFRVKSDGSGLEMVAWGFRNPEGLAWDPAGHLYAASNGPTGDLGLCCHDELDLIQPGQHFYGWPAWAANTRTSYGQGALPDRVPPLAESGGSTWAPSGIAFFAASAGQRPALYMATLKGESLRRFIIDPADPAKVTAQEVVFEGQGRLREVVAGPDGCLYLTTSDRDGRGSPRPGDDRVLKLCPR